MLFAFPPIPATVSGNFENVVAGRIDVLRFVQPILAEIVAKYFKNVPVDGLDGFRFATTHGSTTAS